MEINNEETGWSIIGFLLFTAGFLLGAILILILNQKEEYNPLIKVNNDLNAGFNQYKEDTMLIVNSTIKLVYCEDLDNLFVGLEDKKVEDSVLSKYGKLFNKSTIKPYILTHALYCDINDNECTYYINNDWVIGRSICKNFNFKLKELFRGKNETI